MILTDEERATLINEWADFKINDLDAMLKECESAVLRKLRERPADVYMRDGWGPDCGPYVELYKASEMGWRDKEGWTPLHIIPGEEP